MSETMERISKTSRRLAKFCLLLTLAIPIGLGIYWIVLPHSPGWSVSLPAPVGPDTETVVLFLGFVVTMIPGMVTMYGLLTLKRLFELYQAGRVFQPENVACYRRLGVTLFALAGAKFLSTPLLSLVLTMNAPPGEHLLAVSLYSEDVVLVLVALVVSTIAWVMDEARKMRQEYELII